MKTTAAILLIPLAVFANSRFCTTDGISIRMAPDFLVVDKPVTNVTWHFPDQPEGQEPQEQEPYATTNVTFVRNPVVHPSDAQYLSSGWLYNAVEPPAPSNGFHAVLYGYVASTNSVYAKYSYYPDKPAAHTYRKSYMAQWLYSHGLLGKLSDLLSSDESANMLWSYCTEFDSDDRRWPAISSAVKSGLGLSDEEFEDFLRYSETGL